MEKSSVYNIGFKSLSLGEHLFEFQIDNDFLEKYKNEDVQNVSLSVNLILDKKERLLSLSFQIDGHIGVPCDRCLEETKVEISSEEIIYVKFGKEEEGVLDENIIFIPAEEYQIDVGGIINDIIALSKPIRVVHSGEEGDVCDPIMLAKIDEYTAKNKTNAAWSALEELKNKMSNKQ